jgi:hypothetical protein
VAALRAEARDYGLGLAGRLHGLCVVLPRVNMGHARREERLAVGRQLQAVVQGLVFRLMPVLAL